MMNPTSSDLTSLLSNELSQRCHHNPRYSLRSFARDLGVDHSLLSKVISKKREPSAALIRSVSERLQLGAEMTMALLTQKALSAAGVSQPITVSSTDESYHYISDTDHAQIANWVTYAILSLTLTSDFEPSARWIAKRLGVSVVKAKLSLDVLTRLRMIEPVGNQWKQSTKPIRYENKSTSVILREFQKELLNKATHSLMNDSFDTREVSSITFAMDAEQMEEARALIRKFRRDTAKNLESKSKKKEVYNLTVQLCPATVIRK